MLACKSILLKFHLTYRYFRPRITLKLVQQ